MFFCWIHRVGNIDVFVQSQDAAVLDADREVPMAELVKELEDQMAALHSDEAVEGLSSCTYLVGSKTYKC